MLIIMAEQAELRELNCSAHNYDLATGPGAAAKLKCNAVMR